MRKLVNLLMMGMICMPIGGGRATESLAEAAPAATIAPVSEPWLVSPLRLLVVCAVLLAASLLNRYHKRKLALKEFAG